MAGSLNEVGLRYEDLLIEQEAAVQEALSYASPEVSTGRTRRLKRATDLSFKRKSLLDYAPDMKVEPFKMELEEDIQKILAREAEYAQLNMHKK